MNTLIAIKNYFMNWLGQGNNGEWVWSLLGLVVLFFVYEAAKWRIEKQKDWNLEQKRTFLTQVRNMMWIAAGFILVLSWAKTLVPFLFSLVAVLVALVMATKEWIMCWLGAMYRIMTRAFKVGDHIEIQGIRGEVLDVQWMQTRVLEIGPNNGSYYTGKVLSFPNSWILLYVMKNETFFDSYGFCWLSVPLSVNDDVELVKNILIKHASKVCEGYLEDAKVNMKVMQKMHFMDGPSLSPKTHLEFKGMGELQMNVRFPAPHGQGDVLSQEIIQEFLKEYTPSTPKEWVRGKLN